MKCCRICGKKNLFFPHGSALCKWYVHQNPWNRRDVRRWHWQRSTDGVLRSRSVSRLQVVLYEILLLCSWKSAPMHNYRVTICRRQTGGNRTRGWSERGERRNHGGAATVPAPLCSAHEWRVGRTQSSSTPPALSSWVKSRQFSARNWAAGVHVCCPLSPQWGITPSRAQPWRPMRLSAQGPRSSRHSSWTWWGRTLPPTLARSSRRKLGSSTRTLLPRFVSTACPNFTCCQYPLIF